MSVKMNDIDNTRLEEAMQEYMKDQDKEHLVQLVYAIQETKLFVPAMAVQKQKQGGFQPYIIKNAEGDMYMPAFTSMKKFPQNQKYQGMLKIQYKQCVSMLLDHPSLVQGIALNPFSDNLMLKSQMLELSRKVEQSAKQAPKAYSVKTDDFRMVVRHNVEFHQIPEKLFAQKMEFIKNLNEEVLCDLYKAPYIEVGQAGQYPYTKDSFEMMELSVRDDLSIIQIIAPSKFLYQTNCRELYIVWNPLTEQFGYFVIEKGLDTEEVKFHLDRIKEDGSCEKLEEAPADGNVMNRVMELFGGEP